MGGLTKDTPYILIQTLLFTTGFTRSLFYTGLNALSYSEMELQDMAQATALNACVQQLTIATSIALAGAILEVSTLYAGALTNTAFQLAFICAGSVCALGALPIMRLHASSGADVSGHSAQERI